MSGVGEETITLGEERDRLDERLDELAEQIADAEEAQALMQVASDIQTRLGGVSYLCDEYGDEATVTVRGLNTGEYARVEDKAADLRQEAGGSPIPGAHKNVFSAMGLVEAPFLASADDLDDRLSTVAAQPVGVSDWIHNRVDNLTTVTGEDFRPLSERLAALSE